MGVVEFLVTIFFRVFHFGFHEFLKVFNGKKQGLIPPIYNEPLLSESATKLAQLIRTRKVSSEDVVKAFINRSGVVNPIINAINENRFTSALDEAREADRQLATTKKSVAEIEKETPFLGVPISAKNSIGIKGLTIDCGVVYRKGRISSEDSAVVQRMKKAGAIPLCITNIPELCVWWDANNNIYGRTGNPYDLTRIPGGSSGGEAALIASAGSVIGLGNDIGGSIRSPAFCCGIFGHKPTPGVIPLNGQYPNSHDTGKKMYNTTGPMCRYADDLLPMVKVLSQNDERLKLDENVDVENITVLFTEEYIDAPYTTPIHPDMNEAVIKVVKKLQDNRKLKVQRVRIPHFNNAMPMWFSKLSTAAAPKIEHFLNDGRYDINPYWELLKSFFGLSNHSFHMIFSLIAWRRHSGLREPELSKNLKMLDDLKSDLISLLGKDGVLIYPPLPEPAIFHQEQFAKNSNQGYIAIFNALGFPATQCPIGLNSEGLPLGVQVVAAPYNDRLTLAIAKEIEDLFGGWKSPW